LSTESLRQVIRLKYIIYPAQKLLHLFLEKEQCWAKKRRTTARGWVIAFHAWFPRYRGDWTISLVCPILLSHLPEA